MSESKYCSKCGKQHTVADRFCTRCGNSLDAVSKSVMASEEEDIITDTVDINDGVKLKRKAREIFGGDSFQIEDAPQKRTIRELIPPVDKLPTKFIPEAHPQRPKSELVGLSKEDVFKKLKEYNQKYNEKVIE